MDAEQIYDQVERRLQISDERLDFHAIKAGVQQDEDWWYVPVITEMKGGRPVAREFAIQILAKVETALFEECKVNVLLIPSVPEAASA